MLNDKKFHCIPSIFYDNKFVKISKLLKITMFYHHQPLHKK